MTYSIAPKVKKNFACKLIAWQKTDGRHDLPWQNTRDPYRVWLSEIMLQQTQVATVKAYYTRFLEHFSTVQELACASIDDVLSLWSGLGYYSRARNLHRCAQQIVNDLNGEFPKTLEELLVLPGIGRSTAAAIAAFCFGQRVSILDGNVKRVLTRVLAYEGDIASSQVDKALWRIAQELLPTKQFIAAQQNSNAFTMTAYTQGLMDLGASVCLPRVAYCEKCPMQDICLAHNQKRELEFPHKIKKLKRSTRSGELLWLTSPMGVWLVQRPDNGIWGRLMCMPVLESTATRDKLIAKLKTQEILALPRFKHVLTHIDWMLQPSYIRVDNEQALHLPQELKDMGGKWFSLEQAMALGLPAPIRQLLLMTHDELT